MKNLLVRVAVRGGDNDDDDGDDVIYTSRGTNPRTSESATQKTVLVTQRSCHKDVSTLTRPL
jgi:hypothetical protein